MKRYLAALAWLLAGMSLPGIALAQDAAQPLAKVHYYKVVQSGVSSFNVLSSAPLNGSASSLLYTAEAGSATQSGWDGYSYGKLLVDLAYVRGAGTATYVTLQVSCSNDGKTTYFNKATRSCSTGTCKNYIMTDRNYVDGSADDEDASAGNENWELEYDVRGEFSCKLQVGASGAAAADLISMQVTLVAGG